jgi:hypothetical protein
VQADLKIAQRVPIDADAGGVKIAITIPILGLLGHAIANHFDECLHEHGKSLHPKLLLLKVG